MESELDSEVPTNDELIEIYSAAAAGISAAGSIYVLTVIALLLVPEVFREPTMLAAPGFWLAAVLAVLFATFAGLMVPMIISILVVGLLRCVNWSLGRFFPPRDIAILTGSLVGYWSTISVVSFDAIGSFGLTRELLMGPVLATFFGIVGAAYGVADLRPPSKSPKPVQDWTPHTRKQFMIKQLLVTMVWIAVSLSLAKAAEVTRDFWLAAALWLFLHTAYLMCQVPSLAMPLARFFARRRERSLSRN